MGEGIVKLMSREGLREYSDHLLCGEAGQAVLKKKFEKLFKEESWKQHLL